MNFVIIILKINMPTTEDSYDIYKFKIPMNSLATIEKYFILVIIRLRQNTIMIQTN